MTESYDWKAELFREKSLWQIYAVARRFAPNKFNVLVRKIALVIIIFIVCMNELFTDRGFFPAQSAVIALRAWANSGLSFASQILGFLVAGFTIFATVSKRNIFVLLAENIDKSKNISHLKVIFFQFMRVFIIYISFCALSIISILLGTEGGIATQVVGYSLKFGQDFRYVILYIMISVYTLWFLELILSLKSFIWNVYQALILIIVLDDDKDRPEPQDSD